ncbi:MAG: alanine--tRNA ligase [Armatimonadetes bacterium]|nr:alanine--tRNA ligase [Armatimonadota bacterium]
MTSRELRQSFLDFFRERGHTVVPSAPVVPHGDPTLLFTNAGMNQFKDVFLGTGIRDYSRAADTQKCVRVSGKHNDLEEVGHDTYHHTFFEMLGNWSFGDYYKREAITWAWQLVTQVWGLPKERIHVSVYRAEDGSEQDQEAYDIWRNETDINPDHIHWFGAKDNFWEMGETGPCGPCSEIHFDRTPDCSGGSLVNAGVQDVIEFWNLVFIQYNRKADGTLEELPAKHVDTGMGFERICALVQGKSSNYDTDVFMPLLQEISRISGNPYSGGLDDRPSIAMRVLADHVRTVAFAIADGAAPGNAGRGYVLRRLLRRAVKYGFIELDVKEPILYRLVDVLVQTMGDIFPEIARQQEYIKKIIRAEEEQFGATIEKGMAEFEQRTVGGTMVNAADAFFLYDTCGFPLDLTELLAREREITVDVAGFNLLMDEQKRRAREARKSVSQEAVSLNVEGNTEFVGYDQTTAEASVLAVTEHGVVLDRTPLYAEMGGQVSDHGTATIGGEVYPVSDVRKIGNLFLHTLETEPAGISVGDHAVVQLASDYRGHIQRNHSATHILHEALRRVLGSHVQQAGSLVASHHLRFDFNHFSKVGEEELREIEAMVNAKIREGIAVRTEEVAIEDARRIPNVKMFFGDKYGSRVRVVTIDPTFSVEFCGGTHVRNTADIGFFKLTAESSIQAGVRRIEAITGVDADALLLGRYQEIERLSKRLGVSDRELYQKVESLLEEKKGLEKELAEVRLASAAAVLDDILNGAATINGVRIASGRVAAADIEALKSLGDDLRNRLGIGGVGLLGAEVEGKAQFVCVVTDDLTGRLSAGKIVGAVAKLVGGGGGGKAHLATAGGRQTENLESALGQIQIIVSEMA